MTAPLKWRSQLCPCGYCPDGTRIRWRHNLYELLYGLDIHFETAAQARSARARDGRNVKHTGGPEAGK